MTLKQYTGKQALVPGKLRGYRVWRVDPYLGALCAMNNTYIWTPGVNVAKCNNNYVSHTEHVAPVSTCSCGFYARYSPLDLRDLCINRDFILVVGAIDATGIVQHGTRGFRAEKVEIVAVCPLLSIDYEVPTQLRANPMMLVSNIIREIVFRLRVPSFKTMKDLTREFPQDDLSHILEDVKDDELTALVERAKLIKQQMAGYALMSGTSTLEVAKALVVSTMGSTSNGAVAIRAQTDELIKKLFQNSGA